MTLQDLLNRRITTYLAACSEGKRHPDHIGMYYAGGTLCLSFDITAATVTEAKAKAWNMAIQAGMLNPRIVKTVKREATS